MTGITTIFLHPLADMKYNDIYDGPIIDLTHLAEEPAPENDTNEICSELDQAAVQVAA